MIITKTQIWARLLSKNLLNSYDSSAEIPHDVTSGELREAQILDVLKIMLPKRHPVLRNVVIMDSTDTQTVKFDGAIVDIDNWPTLHSEKGLIVTPIESVKIALEIKSSLGKKELAKIFYEAKNINDTVKFGAKENPKVVGFSYKCANPKLAYFDFVQNFISSPLHVPYVICLLNIGLLFFIDKDSKTISTSTKNIQPVILEAKEDALLLFIYLLTQLLVHEQVSETLRQYSKHIFEEAKFFSFEDKFINKMRNGNSDMLRDCFKGLKKNFEQAYEKANAL